MTLGLVVREALLAFYLFMFKYFNPNPLFDGNKKGWKSVDCAVRSICAATDLNWTTVYDILCRVGRETFSMPHELSTYHRVVTTKYGFKLVQKCKSFELKVKDIVKLSKKDKRIYLCKVKNHYVCCKSGVILDTWDSSECYVSQYWVL